MLSRLLTTTALSLAAATLVACSGSNKVGQCNATSECPAGEVCKNKVCAKTCDSTTICPGGYSCQNGLCVTGSTGAPEITSIAGMSTEVCDGEACIGSGFAIHGAHLANATFTLSGPDNASTSYEMKRTNDATNDAVAELTPVFPRRQVDLGEGTYALTVVNQAGTTTDSVNLLRGDPGPDLTADQLIDRINTASTGKKIQARFLDVVGGGGGSSATGTLTTYADAAPGVDSTLALREMKVVVTGNGTNAASVPINESKLEELCADANGCSITLGATRFHDQTVPSYIVDAPLNGGECRFYLDLAKHSWTLSQDCVATYGLYAPNATGTYVFSRAYQRYEYSNAYGFDGSGSSGTYTCGAVQGSDLDGQPLIVASFKGACYFAEAPADTTQPHTGCFTTDGAAGFYLTASHPAWDYPGAYPKADNDTDGDGFVNNPSTGANTATPAPRPWVPEDTARQCVLTIKD